MELFKSFDIAFDMRSEGIAVVNLEICNIHKEDINDV